MSSGPNDRGEGFTWRHWLKRTTVVDVNRRLIVAQTTRRGPTSDFAFLDPLVDAARQRVPIALVLADAEFNRERNHPHTRQTLQARRVMLAKRDGAKWQIHSARAHMRQQFPVALYRRRVLIELLTSAATRQPSVQAPGRSLRTRCSQALLLGIAYNIYRPGLIALCAVRRMSTEPGCP